MTIEAYTNITKTILFCSRIFHSHCQIL